MKEIMTTNYEIKYYPVGVEATSFNPGDFILVETDGIPAKIIRFGQWVRYHGAMKKFAKWNHAALIVSAEGDLIEARPTDVSRKNISEYTNCPVYVVSTRLNKQSQDQAIAAAESFLNDGYGWLTILSIVLQLLTGVKFQVSFGNKVICSGLVAMSLWAGGIIFNDNPFQMMPADLAAAFNMTRIPND